MPPPRPKFLGLAATRAAAQVLALASFLLVARMLGDVELGVVATGLALFSVLLGIGDLGMSRTIVRYVAVDPRALWPAFRRCAVLRVAGGAIAAIVAVGIVAATPGDTKVLVVALAGAIAVASGVTELSYAALRSIAYVRLEAVTRVAERLLFLGLAAVLLVRGWGPVALLVLYLVTNLVTAGVTTYVTRRRRTAEEVPPGAMIDQEARHTGVALALATLGPRVSPVILALAFGPAPVGVFAVGQRVVEAVVLFTLSTAASLLPILRHTFTRGLRKDAEEISTRVLGALLLVIAPVAAWWIVAPEELIDLLFGANRYNGAATVLRILGVTSICWIVRGITELVLLAEGRARVLMRGLGIGTVVNVLIGVPMAIAWGAAGAALATLAGEIFATGVLLGAVPSLRTVTALREYRHAILVGFGAALALVVATASGAPTVPVGVLGATAGGCLALVAIHRIDQTL